MPPADRDRAGDDARAALVSVVIPAYNCSATILRTLGSVAAQTYAPIEILVVDDCSSDNTRERVQGFRSVPVKLIALGTNGGPSRARNAGIRAASGIYVAFLDADDEWAPTKIERQVAALRADPACTMATCDAYIASDDGRIIAREFADAIPVAGPEAWRTLLRYSFITTPSVVARREAVIQVGGFDEAMQVGEDQHLWIRLASLGSVAVIDAPLVRVHTRGDSHMARHADLEVKQLLPMIEAEVDRLSDRLSKAEARRILGERFARIGRNAYGAGNLAVGMHLILRSMGQGHKIFSQLFYLVHACPPGRAVKGMLRRCFATDRGRSIDETSDP